MSELKMNLGLSDGVLAVPLALYMGYPTPPIRHAVGILIPPPGHTVRGRGWGWGGGWC